MPAEHREFLRTLRSGSLVLGVWVAFFGLQVALSLALTRRGPGKLPTQIELDLVIAVLWASLSFAIAGWHRRIRAIAPNVLALIALHLPLLFLAALLDTAVTRVAMLTIDPARQLTPFWAFPRLLRRL